LSYGTLPYPDTNVFANFTANVNSYAQIILQNTNSGNSASTDFIVSNNTGTSTSYYGDFGINSSGFVGTGSLSLANAVYLYSANSDLSIGTASNNPIHFVVNSSSTDVMTITSAGITVNGTTSLSGNVAELVSINASSVSATTNFYVGVQSVLYYTGASTANQPTFTLAITGTSSATLNSMMNIGQSVSIALFVTNTTYASFPNVIQIDGTTVTPKWANGVLISAGNTYATDVYNFTIIKTANATFTVFGSQVKYA
jgi:hypothetical protein